MRRELGQHANGELVCVHHVADGRVVCETCEDGEGFGGGGEERVRADREEFVLG